MSKPVSLTLRSGMWAGLAGGFAEIVVISAYAALTGTSAAVVARGVSEAVGLGGVDPASSIMIGIVVHMALAVALGVALAFALQAVWPNRPAGATYLPIVAALAAVWTINFFVVLPVLSPAFVTIVPYPISFLSKFLFGISAAEVFRRYTAAAQIADQQSAIGRGSVLRGA